MPPYVYLIIAAVVVLVIALIVISTVQQKKRTEAWQRIAEQLGLTFLGDNNDLLKRFGHLRVFQHGRSRRMRNAVVGDAGDTEIAIGDYRYTTGGGRNSKTHDQTVCILRSDELDLPHCHLRPEIRFFDFLGGLLGGQDIDFEEDPVFSKAYVLQGSHEGTIRQMFDEPTRAWFSQRRDRRFHFEALGDTLVFHTGRHVKPQQTPELMQQALEIKKLLAARPQTG